MSEEELRGKGGAEMSSQNETERATDAPNDAASSQMSAAIEKILENPELITMVASALGGGARGSASGETVRAEQTDGASDTGEAKAVYAEKDSAEEAIPTLLGGLAPMLASLSSSPLSKGHGKDPVSDRRACLLNALKPYLCRERCEAIDYMIKLGRISELFRNV